MICKIRVGTVRTGMFEPVGRFWVAAFFFFLNYLFNTHSSTGKKFRAGCGSWMEGMFALAVGA